MPTLEKKYIPTAWGFYWLITLNGEVVASCDDSELTAEIENIKSEYSLQ